MTLLRRIAPLAAGALLLVAAGCSSRNVTHGTGDGEDHDMAVAVPDLAGPCDDGHPCAAGQRCQSGACVPDYGRCNADPDCQNDTFCDCTGVPDGGAGPDGGGACTCQPWGNAPRGPWEPTCRRPPYALSDVVTPKLRCAYLSDAVETSPLVGDLDGDGLPEIVFMTIGGGLHAMHGADCSPYFDVQFEFAEWNASQLAMGDLDSDGKPEIVGVDRSRRVAIFDNHGMLLASSQLPYLFAGGEELGGMAIADVDGQKPPEIVLAGQVLRYVVSGDKREIRQVWVQTPSVPFWGSLSAVADINGDGKPEVLTGKELWAGTTGDDRTPGPLTVLDGPGAYPAIADFNLDGKADLGMVMAGNNRRRVAIYDFQTRGYLLGPLDAPEAWGGPPVVADFDGDGVPEMGVAGIDAFTVYSHLCAGANPPAKCDPMNPGVLWSRRIQDHSSGSSGSVAFDFNGDGAAEIVYRDECWLRAFDGKNGHALWAIPATSATGVELPPVADVDGDGHAEIVVSSTAFPNCDGRDDKETGARWTGSTNGVMIYSDPKAKWMPARPVWNQHTYHVTNVNDDLTIPEHETPGWSVWNGYRQNEQGIEGKPAGIGDFTARAAVLGDTGPMNCAKVWTLWAQVCNRGAGTVQKGVRGTFYLADPSQGTPSPLCTTTTSKSLVPGQCEQVSCDWMNPTQIEADLWFRANDDGASFPKHEECRTDNNLLKHHDRCKQIM